MLLSEYVVPVLSIAGPAALVFVILRCFPLVARAVVVLIAGVAAIVTRDPKRRAACFKVLDKLSQGTPGEKVESPPDQVSQPARRTLPRARRRA
jgi:hypothetical protein